MNFPVPEPSTLSLCLTHTLISVLVFWVVLSWVYKRRCSFILESKPRPHHAQPAALRFLRADRASWGSARDLWVDCGWAAVCGLLGKWLEVTPWAHSHDQCYRLLLMLLLPLMSHILSGQVKVKLEVLVVRHSVWVDAIVCLCLFVCVGKPVLTLHLGVLKSEHS